MEQKPNYPIYVTEFLKEADKDNPPLAIAVRRLLALQSRSSRKMEPEELQKLKQAISDKDKDTVEAILQTGGNLNTQSLMTNPLFRAASTDDVQIAKLLIDHGADVNCIVYKNSSPLAFVRSAEMLNLFLEHGAKLNLSENEGDLLFITAINIDKIKMVDILLPHYDINGVYDRENTQVTPLMAAVLSDRYAMVEHLLEKGANPNIRVVGYAHQPAYTALEAARYRLARGYTKHDIEDLLLKHGAKE